LLVRAKNFRRNYYGLVAGFVETGESLEECVAREVYEETGITITNIRYYGSQPWPYPMGLMVGFYADYVEGDVSLLDGELSEAAFFSRDHLPPIPEKLSMARRLIDNWVKK
jgi:NAD+ diphosphatase